MKETLNNDNDNAVVDDKTLYGKKTKAVPKPKQNVGIDTEHKLANNIIGKAVSSQLDVNQIMKFTQISDDRNRLYNLIDAMAQDVTISAMLEIYAEDVTETNDQGQIVWCESEDKNVLKYVNFLLQSIQVDKYMYKWAYCLCLYGDLYVQLFRQSQTDAKTNDSQKNKTTLNEAINFKTYDKNDKYSHYVEMKANPAQMFELTQYGKSIAYIDTHVTPKAPKTTDALDRLTATYTYSYNENDIDIYEATSFVHATLDSGFNRSEEQVQLFIGNDTNPNIAGNSDKKASVTYSVRKGKPLFYNLFKIWRILSLLENSVILDRTTKSSIIRLINVQVGDMPKEQVGAHLLGIKQMMEQKAALDTDNSLNEYTNAGPIENNVYVPVRGEVGAISASQIGGDVNVGDLVDLTYFRNLLYGGSRIPKQYLNQLDDNAGFSGGQSLAQMSSRYAKAVKRIQNSLIQMLTDMINLMLIDKGLNAYINQFTLKMQAPTTQEEIDRRENEQNRVGMIADIMNILDGVDDPTIKLKITKNLLATAINDEDVLQLLDEQIKKLEGGQIDKSADTTSDNTTPKTEDDTVGTQPKKSPSLGGLDTELNLERPEPIANDSYEESTLPTPEEVGIGDLTDNNNENI